MIQQLRVLDPAMSAEPGTPERKLIDLVAIKIAEGEIDLSALQSGFSLDTKFGSNLDAFLKMFRFGRQQPTPATGFVTFSREGSPAPFDIRIPTGTRVIAPATSGSDGLFVDIQFRTTFDVVLRQGATTVVAPIEAVVPGSLGNVAANRISGVQGLSGIYSVTNALPTSGGLSLETDDSLKARFKNQVFRNVSGTYDQYLALALATPSTRKAAVIGPISRYREYIQVPNVDDATADPEIGGETGNDVLGEGRYTSAMSTIPYAQHTYETIPHFISNGQLGAAALFFRSDTDYLFNTSAGDKNKGDAYRQAQENPGEPYWDPTDDTNATRPSVTFLNVYTGATTAVQGVRPADVLLFEHSYMSSATRNDWDHGVTNAVDVFVDGGNAVTADCIIPRPSSANLFVDNSSHRYYFENYRRGGEAEHRPVIGNVFTPLFFQPVMSLPEVITIGDTNYYLGSHYWLVEDVSDLAGTIRARNGIEWDKYLPGQANGDDASDPSSWTGDTILWGDDGSEIGLTAPAMTITGYTYDKTIADLQSSLDSNRQTTTDPLAHRARIRHLKLDLTVMYAQGVSITDANTVIRAAVQDFLASQTFGSTIQLSDLLQVVHSVSSVDNVRWSRDVPSNQDEIDQRRNRVISVNVDGTPRLGIIVDRIVTGGAGRHEQLAIYVTGAPLSGSFTLYGAVEQTLAFNASAATVQAALRLVTGDTGLVVSGSGTPEAPWIATYSLTGYQDDIATDYTHTFAEGPTLLNTDFFLQDDELPSLPDGLQSGDTVPGLILRPRAQNTWTRGNA